MNEVISIPNPIVIARRLWALATKQALLGRASDIPLGNQFEYGHPFDMAAFAQAYRVHPWVYRAVNITATSLASVPIRIFREVTRGDDVDKTPIPAHPVAQLLKRPNPFTSGYELKEATVGFLRLNGNAYWLLFRTGNSGRVDMIIGARPERIKVVPDDKGRILGYLYTLGSESVKFSPEEVIHHREFNPYHDFYGMPPLEAFKLSLMIDTEARKSNYNFHKNSAIPRGALVTDQKLSPEEKNRLRETWHTAHQGRNQAHKIALLERGIKWTQIGMNARDMDFMKQLGWNRNECGAVFGVPPSKMNDFSQVRANAHVEERDFWHDTLIPIACRIDEKLNLDMWKIEGRAREAIEPTRVEHDFTNVIALRRERMEFVKSDIEQVKVGLRTVNEVRDRDNFQDVPWGDTWHKPQNLIDAQAPADGGDGKSLVVTSIVDLVAEKRNTEWRGFMVHQDRFETLMQRFLVGLFSTQEKIVLERLKRFNRVNATVKRPPRTEAEVELVLFDLDKAVFETVSTSDPLYRRIVEQGGKRGFQLAGVADSFSLANPRAEAFLTSKEQKFAKEINETTWERLKGSLVEGMSAGENTVELAERVSSTMKVRKGQNKFGIARTEVNASLNGGIKEGFKQAEVVETKFWIVAGDGLERDTHAAASGEEVGLDSPFQVGSSLLQFPGDPAGEAKEVIECRCTIGAGKIKKR